MVTSSRQTFLPLIAFGCLRSPLIASDRFPIASLIASRIASLIRYTSTGQLDIVPYTLRSDLVNWRRRFGKPVMLSEYGADAVEGVHSDPPIAFSEEFQAAYLRAHFGVFDELMQARESVTNPL
jgi:beta-glucosidase/6-phospho-beta-glucosidase/beta-galactosidase